MEENKTTQVEEIKDPAAGGQAAKTTGTEGAEEKMTAFQKFLEGLFGGQGKEKTGAEGKETPAGEPEKTFTQADLDAAVKKAQKEWESRAAEEKRLAGLSPEEKAKEEQKQKDEKIAELQSQILAGQLKQEAIHALTKDGYPPNLADLLDYSSKEGMETSLKNVVTMYKNSLEEGIKKQLKGKVPEGLGAAGMTENLLRDQIAKNIRGL